MAIQQRAFVHVKATGVIRIYDFLNLPTANCLAVLFIKKTEKGDIMKISKLFICTGLIFVPIVEAHALVACRSLETCSSFLLDGYCCCPTGNTGTTYTCPDGWTATTYTAGATCSRADETGTNDLGTYTASYGTCTVSSNTYACYTSKASSEADSSCFCTISKD